MEKVLSWLFGLAFASCILATVVANLNIGDKSADCVGCDETHFRTVRDSTTNIGYIGRNVIGEPEKVILNHHECHFEQPLKEKAGVASVSLTEKIQSLILFNSNYLTINGKVIDFDECNYVYKIEKNKEIWSYDRISNETQYTCAFINRDLRTRNIELYFYDISFKDGKYNIDKHVYK